MTQKVQFPKAEGYNIRVGETWFRTVAGPDTPLQVGTRDSLAPRNDDSGSVYQNVLDIGYAWGRTDLSGGEGLDWDPRLISLERNEVALDQIRYWDSEGISTARPNEGEQYSLELARTFEPAGIPVTPDGSLVDMAVSSAHIYVAHGQTITQFDDWSGAGATDMTGLPAATDIIAIAAAPNDSVMAVMADGTVQHKAANATVFTEIYDSTPMGQDDAQGIWYVNGRFIMAAWDGPIPTSTQLWELAWDGTDWIPEGTIDTAESEFWSVVESGPAIVAACGDGTIRTYTPDSQQGSSSTMALLPRARTTAPEGETPILLGANAGILLIMTTADDAAADRQELRLYQAEVLDARFDYVVGQLQLKRQWTASEHEPLVTRSMSNTRDEVFWFVKEENLAGAAVDESLWRFDVVTGGLTRVITVPGVNLNAIVVFDQFIGGIDFTGDAVLVSDPDKHQAEGYVIFPNITFGLNTPITWIATVVEAHDLVATGGQVELWYSTDPTAILDPNDPTWVLTQRLSSQGGSNVEIPFTNLSSRTLSLQLKVKATEAATTSPKVTRIAVRGIPAHRDLMMLVPFNVSDYVSAPGRKPLRVSGLGDDLHSQVLDLVGQSVEVIILDPSIGFRGVVNNVSEPIEYLSDRGSVSRYCMVEFRGQRLTQTVAPTGDAGMGLGLMGIAIMGIGQSEDT